ncbi:hypothetical protein [Candidatus Uabimicrobium amorphum]|uniref:Cytochrome c7-like domain-containing protein n=1 Tax=Uabimicrobium amorphum TaxID=2596890 RepID=A0A5S9IRL3_UABAM|nr:hypothetical protein [Candidatus Uabimicrobium amorphum]BBM86271.1 hypothetical protein UABAM_04657 [Candidatus Uabimicrobium amorphum]
MDIEETKNLWSKILTDEQMESGNVRKTYKGNSPSKSQSNVKHSGKRRETILHKTAELDEQKNLARVDAEETTVQQGPPTIKEKIQDKKNFDNANNYYKNDLPDYGAVKQAVSSLSTKDILETGHYQNMFMLRIILFVRSIFSHIEKFMAKIKMSYVAIAVLVPAIIIAIANSAQLGELTSAHAAIHTSKQNCHMCHTQDKNPRNDALQCTVCHQQSSDEIKNVTALNAHGLPEEYWEKHNPDFWKTQQNSFFNFSIKKPFAQKLDEIDIQKNEKLPPLACSACHQEHQGRNSILTKLSNRKCQTCHKKKFANFSADHAEFNQYPYKRRTNIMFDHVSHFSDYYRYKKKEGISVSQNCQTCHKFGQGEQMALNSFEETCAQCHQKDILKEDEDLNIIRFPGFLIEDFYAQSKAFKMRPKFRKWPSLDEEDSGEATDLMRLLLSKDKELEEEDISEYVETFLVDMIAESPSDEDENEIRAINAYVLMIKRLCDEITNEDTSALKERLQKVLSVSINNKTLDNLFPNVSNILQVVEERILPPINSKRKRHFNAFEFEEKELPTGWYFSNYTLQYRPMKHKDSFMKTWLDLMAKTYNTDAPDYYDEVQGNTSYIMSAMNRCLKCHSVEKSSQKDSVLKINWKPGKRGEEVQFTRFSHQPHVLAQMDCSSCHTLKKYPDFNKAAYNKSFSSHNSKKFVSDFKFISKDLCSKCHNRNLVGENCTSCHNYHAASFSKQFHDSSNFKTETSNKK